jgi:DNA-binding CsgD family transcriptional regulator
MDGGGLLDTSDWLGCCAALAVSEGRYLAALRLLGGVGAKRKRSGSGQADSTAGPVVTHLEQLQGRVEPVLAEQLVAEGAAMSWAELVAEATATVEDAPVPRAPLSPREAEIAALVAEGMTNAEIARKLTISRRTVDSHLDHIRRKLGLRNRRQIVIWSFQQARRRAGAA